MPVVRNNDSRNSVHEKMKTRTADAAKPPRTIGNTIFEKLCQRVAPSIIAASSTSFGTSSKNDFISNSAIGRFIRE